MSQSPANRDPLNEIKEAFHTDDAARVRSLLNEFPGFKAMINQPLGPFGTPAIVNVKSREMLDALLDIGANIDARSNWWAGGFGLLDYASPELSEYAISRGAAVTAHAAARLGQIDMLRKLIASDPDLVHARGGDGQTPLHFASSVEIAELLLDHGADIDRTDIDHESTAAQWMIGDRQHVARCLIARGCRVDLLMAAAIGDLDLIRSILTSNPDAIRTAINDTYFPMSDSRAGGTIYQWSLGWYATAHQVARKFGHPEAHSLLLERSPAPVRLIDACLSHDGEEINRIIAKERCAVDALTEEDRCFVAHAARNNDAESVRLMLEAGFPTDATSQHRATPLHWAAWHGSREMAETILRFGPPLDVRDADHNGTPLGWAIYGSEHGWGAGTGDYAETVELLIAAGAELPEEPGGTQEVREVLRKHGVT